MYFVFFIYIVQTYISVYFLFKQFFFLYPYGTFQVKNPNLNNINILKHRAPTDISEMQ